MMTKAANGHRQPSTYLACLPRGPQAVCLAGTFHGWTAAQKPGESKGGSYCSG